MWNLIIYLILAILGLSTIEYGFKVNDYGLLVGLGLFFLYLSFEFLNKFYIRLNRK